MKKALKTVIGAGAVINSNGVYAKNEVDKIHQDEVEHNNFIFNDMYGDAPAVIDGARKELDRVNRHCGFTINVDSNNRTKLLKYDLNDVERAYKSNHNVVNDDINYKYKSTKNDINQLRKDCEDGQSTLLASIIGGWAGALTLCYITDAVLQSCNGNRVEQLNVGNLNVGGDDRGNLSDDSTQSSDGDLPRNGQGQGQMQGHGDIEMGNHAQQLEQRRENDFDNELGRF